MRRTNVFTKVHLPTRRRDTLSHITLSAALSHYCM